MDLITCKKCAKICSANAKTCPYCGAELKRDVFTDSNDPDDTGPSQNNFTAAGIGLIFLVFLLLALNNASKNDSTSDVGTVLPQSCQSAACPTGTIGITDSIRPDPYYTCKSSELSDYANYVLSLMAAQMQIPGFTPQISKTGEPLVPEKEKAILDQLRKNAGVTTFEEAIAKCYKGISKQRVTVISNPAESNSIYVASEDKPQDKFWLPKARLNK